MTSFNLRTRVKADGTLQVVVPTGLPESDVDVLVVVRPLKVGGAIASSRSSWPEGFFDGTYGCLKDDPLLRPPQLKFEDREKVL